MSRRGEKRHVGTAAPLLSGGKKKGGKGGRGLRAKNGLAKRQRERGGKSLYVLFPVR